MDTVQRAKLDIRNSGKPVGAEMCGIDLLDNYSTQHMAVGDYALPQRRLMHRTANCGTDDLGRRCWRGESRHWCGDTNNSIKTMDYKNYGSEKVR